MIYRVLVIERDPMLREVLVEFLQLAGYKATSTETDLDGIIQARTWLPDLILLGLPLRNRVAYNVASALRHYPATAQIPIVLLAARHPAADIKPLLELGISDWLEKPFKPEDLLALIQKVRAQQARPAHRDARFCDHPPPRPPAAPAAFHRRLHAHPSICLRPRRPRFRR